MTPQQILDSRLLECFSIHNVKIPEKYHTYILKAMNEFGQQCFEAGRDLEKHCGDVNPDILLHKTFEDYLKTLK